MPAHDMKGDDMGDRTSELEVVLVGTGSPLPHPDRAGPSTLVRAGDRRLLIDCGRGVLMRLAAIGVFPPFLSAVLLTHLHSDHICDFNDVLTTRWVMSPVEAPLHVIGPPGTQAFVDATMAMLRDDIGWRIAHHDDLVNPPTVHVTEILSGVIDDHPALAGSAIRIVVAPTDHKPAHPTIGFRIEHDGAAVAIVGDTLPCPGVDELCADASIYVQTVIREAAVRSVPSARLQDILDYHSTNVQAGSTARRNRVGTLVMTHMVPPPDPASEQGWIDEAAAEFGGRIVLGSDLAAFTAERPT